MVKYENLKSEKIKNPKRVIEMFSLLLYGNEAGSVQMDELLEMAMKSGFIEEKEPKYVFYTWLTIDGVEKKYYKACGPDLTTKKSKAWVYTKSELKRYEAYKKLYDLEEIEDGEFDND